jgi:hypothetical protein
MSQRPLVGQGLHIIGASQSHSVRYLTLSRTFLDEWSARHSNLYLLNTQHSQETDIHASGGIRTRNPSMQAAEDPRVRPRGRWDPGTLNSQALIIHEWVITNTHIVFDLRCSFSSYHSVHTELLSTSCLAVSWVINSITSSFPNASHSFFPWFELATEPNWRRHSTGTKLISRELPLSGAWIL